MIKSRRKPISLSNPFVNTLGLISIGGIGLIGYQFAYGLSCVDTFFYIGFIISVVTMTTIVARWAKMFEAIESFTVSKMPTSIILVLASLNIYIAFSLINYDEVFKVDSRLDAYGSSVMIMTSTVVNAIFFPFCFFAAKFVTLSRFVLLIFILTTGITLFVAPSKSAIFGLFFTILLYYFIDYKQSGRRFPVSLVSIKSLFFFASVVAIQLALMVIVYGDDFIFQIGVILYRIANNFDAAIYGCMIQEGRFSPNSFFTYTILPVLKRIDGNLYNLDFFNVPQWLIYEALSISRYGRTGFPNDNLFVGLYFGGFGVFSVFVFALIVFVADYLFVLRLEKIKRTRIVNPITLALLVKLPLLYQSTQEFFGLIVIALAFMLFAFLFRYITLRNMWISAMRC